ncbi:MAG: ATP-binding protein [Bacteroidota bacterium]
MRLRLGLVAALVAGGSLSGAVVAQPAPLPFQHLGTEAGLSGLGVMAVETDPEGFVWLGALGAVDRWEGARVRSFPTGGSRENGYIYALARGPGGVLWAGGEDGLWRMEEDMLVPVRLGGASPHVRSLTEADGALWVGTVDRGLFRLGGRVLRLGDGPTRVYTEASGHLLSDSVRAVAALPDGRLAVATTGGVSVISADRRRVRHRREMRDARGIVVAAGRVWVGRSDGSVVALDGSAEAPGLGEPVSALVASEVAPGWVWVGTRGSGLRLFDARTGTFAPEAPTPGLPRDASDFDVLSLHEHDGVLWLGVLGLGAYHAEIRRSPFRVISDPPDGPLGASRVIGAHLSPSDPDVVWVGTIQGGLHRVRRSTGEAEQWFAEPGHPLRVVFDAQEDAEGGVWIAGQTSDLWRLDPATGRTETVTVGGRLTGDLMPSRAYPGHLWVATDGAGLVRLDVAGRAVAERYLARMDSTATVWQVAEAEDALWVATAGAGLWRLDLGSDGSAERIVPDCPLGDVLATVTLAPDGTVWTGDATGRVLRLDPEAGECRTYDQADGLPADGVGALVVDASGAVWNATNSGLFRLDPEAGAVSRFSASDGLPISSLYWYARSVSATGEIAFGGEGGAVVFDPAAVRVDTASVPTVLSGLTVDGEPRPVRSGFALGHRENDVAFAITGMDLRQPEETRYRVRLLGASDEWEPTGPSKRYLGLSPGRYTFQAQATNRDGYWSAPLSVPFRIRPPFWQTVPFWLAILATLGALGYAGHRVRIEQIRRVERTRRRIADDLHDDIGSKVSSVALRLDMVRRKAPLPGDVGDTLAALARTARGVVGDLRDTVWIVDAEHDDLASVVARMEQLASRALDGRGTVEIPNAVPDVPLGMEVRRDLYLLFSEALHNAVRHSGADRIDVRVRADVREVAFVVEDDGVGLGTEAGASGGRGLRTMHRRAAALGGNLALEPGPGGGTAVRFALPLT